MSYVRNAAYRLADLVVRYASPGSKEWARAIESELVYIESDWRALAWALSGTRVLFNIQPSPLLTIGDLDSEAEKYADRRRHSMNNGWLARNLPLLQLLAFAAQFILNIAMGRNIFSSVVRLSGLLLLIPMLYVRTREPYVPDRDDRAGLVRFYVEELSAISSTSMTFWMFVAGALLMILGPELMATALWERAISLLLVPFLALFLTKHRNNRRRLGQVKALLTTTSDQSL
jgi:hypothetical protein